MKVVLLGCTPPPVGGIAEWTMRMLKSQLKNGWEIILVDDKMIGGRESFGNGTKKNYFIEAKRVFSYWKRLTIALKDKEAKVVHSCPIASYTSMMKEYGCALITKRAKRGFVAHFRCTIPNMVKNEHCKRMLVRFCNKCDHIMVLNNQSYQYLENLTTTPITVVPNFVNDQEIVEHKEIRETVKKALYVGGVTVDKGCLDVIETAKAFPAIEFRLVGRASNDIEEAANSCQNVTLVGVKKREELKAEYANADVFMFLSHFSGEGFSNALAEAMAAGMPCIVTDWAANADMVEDGKGGYVVACHTPGQAVNAMQRIMPQDLRTAQSKHNIEKVHTQYSKESVLSTYVDIYEKYAQ